MKQKSQELYNTRRQKLLELSSVWLPAADRQWIMGTGAHTHRRTPKLTSLSQQSQHRTEGESQVTGSLCLICHFLSFSLSFACFKALQSVHLSIFPSPLPLSQIHWYWHDTFIIIFCFHSNVPAHQRSEVWVSCRVLSTAAASQTTLWLCSFWHRIGDVFTSYPARAGFPNGTVTPKTPLRCCESLNKQMGIWTLCPWETGQTWQQH